MAYLTHEEFEKYSSAKVDENEFNQLVTKASAVLDNVTNYFYVKNDIEKDNEWRVNQFKQALIAQIEYFEEAGATTWEGINKAPQSFSAGRTTVTNANRSSDNESKSLITGDVYLYLEGTGLLNRAVSVW